jgi:hypothetical protein
MTREEAIARLVQQDVDRWGESERPASERAHAFRTRGLAVNELANRADLAGDPGAAALRRQAKAALTDDDRDWLRNGAAR